MTARIFLKLIAAALIIMAIAFAVVDILASRMAKDAYVQGLDRELREKIRMLAVISEDRGLEMTPERIRSLAVSAGGRLTIIEPSGVVLADSEANPSSMENHAHRPEIAVALRGDFGTSIRPSPTLGVDFLYVAGPVRGGVVRLAVPLTEVDVQVGNIRRRLLLYIAIGFLPAIMVAAFFARYFSTRLGAIIEYASTLATGNFGARLARTGSDELGVLARQLNETGEKLQKVFEELQREHAELEKVERVRKDFVINVSHELRTPLASIQGYTETLLDGALHDAEHNVRFLGIIRQNAERLARLTSDLLTLSRIELRSQRFHFASYYVNQLLDSCIDSLRPVAEKKGIVITHNPAPAETQVFCDSEAVHQVMSNLLDNAIKFTPENGTISVTTLAGPPGEGQEEYVEVRVADSGIGIPPDEIPRLFERFYRVDKARSRELGGTGLGLAIVKHLVRAMGGEVAVESAVDQGSTFSFTLPVHDLGLDERGLDASLTPSNTSVTRS